MGSVTLAESFWCCNSEIFVDDGDILVHLNGILEQIDRETIHNLQKQGWHVTIHCYLYPAQGASLSGIDLPPSTVLSIGSFGANLSLSIWSQDDKTCRRYLKNRRSSLKKKNKLKTNSSN